jgi:DNA-directed RNA polymerase specialized sigma24 family protein
MNEKEKEYNLDRLQAFLKRLHGFLRKRPASKQDMDDLIADLNVSLLLNVYI